MWQFLFWASVAAVFYTYVGYPIILLILGLFRRGRHVHRDHEPPSVCLIISAFNEENVIRHKIENSLELRYPRRLLRIVVASDGSDDGTVGIVNEYAGRGVNVVHHTERRGKSAMLNDVITGVTEDVVVFTDANSLFAPDAVERLTVHFADPQTGCVVGKLRYIDGDVSPVGRGESIYWRYEAVLSRLESRLRSVLVANGSIFAIRRELFRELYPDVANDLQIPADVAMQKRGVVYEPNAVATEQTAMHWHEEFDRKTRIILRGLTGFFVLRDRIRGFRRWQFVSRKLLRWMVGVFASIAFVANTLIADQSLFYTGLLAFHVAFYFTAMVGWMKRGDRTPNRFLYIPFYFTMVNSAALIAMARFVGGRRQQVWEKAHSTRGTSPDATLSVSSKESVDSRAEAVEYQR